MSNPSAGSSKLSRGDRGLGIGLAGVRMRNNPSLCTSGRAGASPGSSRLLCTGYEKRSFPFPMGVTWGLCHTDTAHYLSRLNTIEDDCDSELCRTR
ncbi:hypothetical protein MC885_008451 [Smutsia gigantea]|nr:hypothetical protein MC885_008451 [Smutsia gigantea]